MTSGENANRFPLHPVILVDDESAVLRGYKIVLLGEGVDNLVCCSSAREALQTLRTQHASVVVTDLWMPELSGEKLLEEIRRGYPDIPVIVVTGANEVETAVRCMKTGAHDYIVKPVDPPRLANSVRKALEHVELQQQVALLKEHFFDKRLRRPEAFTRIITRSANMHTIFQYIETIAPARQPVLVTGETGTGKELIAQVIHQLSGRKGEFVAVNVAGFDETIFSDALFGHKKGAYTGADSDRPGLIEKAAGGTLFLDEIGEMNAGSQVKLLRLLQEREYYPLGSDVPRLSDARMVFATNRDVKELENSPDFRKDLYYRLKSYHVHLPPLRDRREDVPLLVQNFMGEAVHELGGEGAPLSEELVEQLKTHSFPGNIRELRATVFDYLSRQRAGMAGDDEPSPGTDGEDGGVADPMDFAAWDCMSIFSSLEKLPTMEAMEDVLLEEALRRADGNKSLAAEMLGITRQTLHKRTKKE